MSALIEFSKAHPVAALVLGSLMFTSLILGGMAILFGARDDADDEDDWRYW